MITLKLKVECPCGHAFDVECMVTENGAAPIICMKCQTHFMLQHVAAEVSMKTISLTELRVQAQKKVVH